MDGYRKMIDSCLTVLVFVTFGEEGKAQIGGEQMSPVSPLSYVPVSRPLGGATENAELDIARPSKLLGLTSRDGTMRDHSKGGHRET